MTGHRLQCRRTPAAAAPRIAPDPSDGQDPRITDPSLGDESLSIVPQARCQSLMRDYDKFPRNLPSQIKICLREICLGFQQNPDLGQLFQIQKIRIYHLGFQRAPLEGNPSVGRPFPREIKVAHRPLSQTTRPDQSQKNKKTSQTSLIPGK